jgi:serine phosphatase RsbU (regulator of sigma subunit)/pSer/pThr/pTyr-binding forkhead associated (FHA) protein
MQILRLSVFGRRPVRLMKQGRHRARSVRPRPTITDVKIAAHPGLMDTNLQTTGLISVRIDREKIDAATGMIDPAAGRLSDTMPTTQSVVPTLQIMNGPMAGRLFNLERDVTTLGRNPDCDVVLQPKSVSRRHAAIFRKATGFEIKDLGSTRGTYVNGQKLSEPILLTDGNTLNIGELQLTFSSRVVQIEEAEDDQSTVYAAIDILNQSDRHFPLVKPEAKFRALRLISQELGGTLVLNEVLDRIFNSLFEIFPRAERGFVLLKEPDTNVLLPEFIRSRTGPAGELKISKTVLSRVLNAGQAILCKDLAQEFPESASISDSKIRSLMCVPLFDSERKTVGVMQIDTRDGRGRFEQDDLDLMAAVAGQISVAVQNAQLHKALVKQREMEHELQFARQVMQSLLPERPTSVPGYDFWAYYEPARHVGGDYYGIIPITADSPENGQLALRWAIAVGDVVGKGMPAALLTAKLSAEVRMFLRGNTTPVRVVEQLNHQFQDGGVLDLYITFLLVVLEIHQHRLSVVNAGHPCPLIRRRDGRLEEIGRPVSGLPLAIMPDYRYEMAETTLEPGETVILYTDGVTDAMNPAGERLGEAAFHKAIAAAEAGSEAVGDAVVKAVQRHVADRPQFDDITLVCLSRK